MTPSELSPFIRPLFSRQDYSGLILIPRKIYYEWSRYIIPENEYLNGNGAELFLLPRFSSNEKAEEFYRLFYDLFFQYKLRQYSENPDYWPVNRTYDMFNQWFEVRIAGVVSSLK